MSYRIKHVGIAFLGLALIAAAPLQQMAEITVVEKTVPIVFVAEDVVQEVPEVEEVIVPELSAQDEKQIQCLAENAYYEARGEGRQGQIAVTNVVMNRVEDRRWPGTACGVVKQRSGRGCQFSWVCKGNRSIRNIALFERVYAIAEDVYNDEIGDNTGGAKFFHSTHARPSWSRSFKRTKKIGSHIFYRG